MNVRLHESWKSRLSEEFEKPYFKELADFVVKEYENQTVFPPFANIFSALDAAVFDDVRVVILGQDPYHGPGQANGLCFSVADGVRTPPSLKNIYKELHNDLGCPVPETGRLESWARQGILLLNSTLTVRAREAGSHQKKGWEQFTDTVVETLSLEREHLVFMLWGRYAQQKGAVIDRSKHLVLEAAHPSPLSAYNGFFGSKHFSAANTYLTAHNIDPIEWCLL